MGRSIHRVAVTCCALLAVAAVAWWGFHHWRLRQQASPENGPATRGPSTAVATIPVRLSAQARENLKLVSKPLQLADYWQTVEFPGTIVDRPGVTDRSVTTLVAGVVTQVHAFPGDAVEPSAPLVTLRLTSESLYDSQLELYKATKDAEIARRKLARLSDVAESGAVPQARVIEIENEIQRLTATMHAYQQDLLARGLPEEQINAAADGHFATEIVVRAPGEVTKPVAADILLATSSVTSLPPVGFEVQSLAVELGQQVSAGQLLCRLADHRQMLVEGHGFKEDMPLVQAAVKSGWNVELGFDSSAAGDWPALPASFPIHYIANAIDPKTRTFAFYVELENQCQTYTRDGVTKLLWRCRPGTNLRLRVPVRKLDNVFVVPKEAVVWEGPEAFVFRQNGEFFDRRPVHVLYEDRQSAVLANDGGIRPAFYIAQGAAASLNRVLKSQMQSASGLPPGMHVHPDGTVHGAH